jgi:hypothetical protein
MNENRIEKKFVLGKHKDDFLKKLLLSNGFNKQYPDRVINSIYMDTVNYDFAKDNISGISNRKKIRFRWYNQDLKKIYFEVKNKRNFNVWKNIEKIEPSIDEKSLVGYLKKNLNNMKFECNNNFNNKLVLKTNYKRSYWLSNNKKIRATIDINLNANSINFFKKKIYFNDTILEFKFSPKDENYFRIFYLNKISYLRSQKYSKYIRSFLELENSGLIN